MNKTIKNILKSIARFSPVPLTIGQRIDRDTKLIIKKICSPNSNCIDIGAHKGEILDLMLHACPNGQHFAFEPIPSLYQNLTQKYDQRVTVFNLALSDKSGEARFQHVTSNPAYSGLKQRRYDRDDEEVSEIIVKVDTLDQITPKDVAIDFIKIDVEGAELFTMQGGRGLLSTYHPAILFEHGKAGAESYGYDAGDIWAFLAKELQYQLYSLPGYLKRKAPLTRDVFLHHYEKEDVFYFLAFYQA